MSELPGRPEESGFLIADTFYPWPSSIRIVDPILVRELTGMDWGEFSMALDGADEGDESQDPRSLVGFVGIAIWQKHPKWKREKVIEFVQQLDFESLNFQLPSGDDASPPDETPADTSTSGGSSEPTEESSATSLTSTGLHPSEITAV